MIKYPPEFSAMVVAYIIASHTGMTFLQGTLLWVFLDLMTVNGEQLKKYLEETWNT